MGEAARKLEAVQQQPLHRRQITLLELVAAVADESRSDAEVIATITHLIHTKQVELIGNFRGSDVEIA
ncbi:MAG: hypothetical protein JRG76_00485 [Deltaproteobacteria bacterium]|nr:hypothetical protein [Deltaproteobacteria bacterium]MBW2412957.1 hypothetical protein [Deltaproteobacteria bacterium]